MNTDDAILVALTDIQSRLARIESLLDPDTARLQSLLPAIARVVGTLSFLVGDLQGDVELDGISPRRLGKMLERHRGECIGGFVIEQLGVTREGREWRLTPVGAPVAPAHNARR